MTEHLTKKDALNSVPLLQSITSSQDSGRIRRTRMLGGLLALAFVYFLYFARPFLLPIVLALLFKSLLHPAVEILEKLHVPRAVGAAVVLLGILTSLGVAIYILPDPLTEWTNRIPQTLARIDEKLRILKHPMERITATTKKIEEMTTMTGPTVKTPTVETKPPSLSHMLFNVTQDFMIGAMLTIILIYFLLTTNGHLMGKIVALFSSSDEVLYIQVVQNIRQDLSKYLFTITLINLCLGIAISSVTYFLELPSPLLWGVIGMLLNFIPYLGAAVTTILVAGVSLLTFDRVTYSLLPPMIVLIIYILEGMVITPMILGLRLKLNPVAIFVGLIFWGWIWGIPGAFLAVPILMATKIFCDQINTLKPIGQILGRD